jgi:cytochrome c oxidase subunit II
MTRSAAAAGAIAVIALFAIGAYVGAQPAERVIVVHTKKFEYRPDRLALKKGEPVILEFVADDVVMGWNLADFGLRADIIPGKATRVRFVPDRTGEFTFFCDIFCGSGHEDMAGSISVTD